jgi:outer membrane protein assembly factor BamB
MGTGQGCRQGRQGREEEEVIRKFVKENRARPSSLLCAHRTGQLAPSIRTATKPFVNSPLRFSLVLTFASTALATDWPQWRGPDRNGFVKDPAHKLAALPAEPKVLWQIDAGPGQSSPVIVGDRVVFMDGVGGKEIAHSLELKTGKEVWHTEIGPMVDFSPAYDGGPRSTPLVDGDRVYAQSSGGEFKCLSLKDGKQIWGVSFGKDYGATFLGNKSSDPAAKETASRRHGNNGSAAIDGDRIFVPVGSVDKGTLVAFDKKTGKQLWAAGSDNTAYSSVVVGTLAGTRQAVHFTADALMGVDAATGKLLWREPLKTGAKRHACTPLIDGDTVTVASTNIGTIRFLITKSGNEFKATRAWENLPLKTVLGTPTQVGSSVFTLGPGNRCDLVALDAKTGAEKWKQGGLADYASITAVNDKLLVLNSTGELSLVRASDGGYEELGRAQVAGQTWASPAYTDGKIVVKDAKKLTLVQLEPDVRGKE